LPPDPTLPPALEPPALEPPLAEGAPPVEAVVPPVETAPPEPTAPPEAVRPPVALVAPPDDETAPPVPVAPPVDDTAPPVPVTPPVDETPPPVPVSVPGEDPEEQAIAVENSRTATEAGAMRGLLMFQLLGLEGEAELSHPGSSFATQNREERAFVASDSRSDAGGRPMAGRLSDMTRIVGDLLR